jgi:hypothetical protein
MRIPSRARPVEHELPVRWFGTAGRVVAGSSWRTGVVARPRSPRPVRSDALRSAPVPLHPGVARRRTTEQGERTGHG